MGRARLSEGRLHPFVRSHVDLAEDAADLARDPFSTFRVSVEHGHLGAALRKLASRRFSKARCPTGHDRGYTVDVHVAVPLIAFDVRLGAERRE
jgi:hypothetical protein